MDYHRKPGSYVQSISYISLFCYKRSVPLHSNLLTMTIGIIREGKTPPDSRVALTPHQCKWLLQQYPEVEIYVQSAEGRCFADAEYIKEGIPVVESAQDCEVLFGVKEVPIEQLMAGKTYFFFSHTIKEQPYNRDLLRTVLDRNIRLIDYEVLTTEQGARVIAFGRWAGIVGAHNGLMAYGNRQGTFTLPRVGTVKDYNALKKLYNKIDLPPMRIIVTGDGRVAKGAMEVLDHLGIQRVDPENFLSDTFEEAIYTQLKIHHLYQRRSDHGFETQEFFDHPDRYESIFAPYTKATDLMINAIYWDPNAPIYFSKEDMQRPDFSIQTIADITCDIEGSVPATLRATTIADPVMGYDPATHQEVDPYQSHTIDIMSVDNLPNELPRDASTDFGDQLIENVWDELIHGKGTMLDRATIAQDGRLGTNFQYLENYVKGN